jgi:hypothetical protein
MVMFYQEKYIRSLEQRLLSSNLVARGTNYILCVWVGDFVVVCARFQGSEEDITEQTF